MFRPALASVVMLGCAAWLSCTIWEKPPKGWAGATGGEQLERMFWQEVAARNWTELERHLAPNFTSVASGGIHDRASSLERWRGLRLEDYSLGDFKVEPNGSDLVVTYTLHVRGTMDGRPLPSGPMHMMSVWQQVKRGWILISHSCTPALDK